MITQIEGYIHVSDLFGVVAVSEHKELISLADDIFTHQMIPYEGKKVRIIIEDIEE